MPTELYVGCGALLPRVIATSSCYKEEEEEKCLVLLTGQCTVPFLLRTKIETIFIAT